MAKEKDRIIKYTIIPKNDKDDYDTNFKLSLTEFAKALTGKSLLAPLILYNSDLDIPLDMDESLEEYIVYTDQDNLLSVIKKQESIDVFRTLIVHGFEISLDEVREIYCPIARKNQADVCINVIDDLELDNNLTFYLYDDLDKCSDEEWEDTKNQINQDMQEYVDEYKNFEEMDEEDLMNLLPLFFGEADDYDGDSLMDILDSALQKKEQEEKEEDKKINNKVIAIPLKNEPIDEKKEDIEKQIISCSYKCQGTYVALNKLDDNLYTIEDDDYEVLLDVDQIDFIIQAYNRIKDKPLK
jgi:hypothetical protein